MPRTPDFFNGLLHFLLAEIPAELRFPIDLQKSAEQDLEERLSEIGTLPLEQRHRALKPFLDGLEQSIKSIQDREPKWEEFVRNWCSLWKQSNQGTVTYF